MNTQSARGVQDMDATMRAYLDERIDERQRLKARLAEVEAEIRRAEAFLAGAAGPTGGDEIPDQVADLLLATAAKDERGATIGQFYEAALTAGLELAQGERGRRNVSKAVQALADRKRLYRSAGGRYKPRKRPA